MSLTTFGQFRPDDLENLSFWLRSDSLVTLEVSGKVSTWGNAAGGDGGAVQPSGNLQPLLVEDNLNGLPAVRFDGFNDFMTFPEQSAIQTVFLVLMEAEGTAPNFRPVLGHSAQFPFLRGPDNHLWHPDFTDSGILDGVTRLNFAEINGTTTTVPASPCLLSIVSMNPLVADQISLDRSNFSSIWNGDWYEVIAYEAALTEEEVLQVENYLADKYMPTLSIIPDVISDNLCDIDVCVSEDFVSYSWNGEDGGNCFSFNSTQSMLLEVTDSFGRVSSQSFDVDYPGASGGEEVVICAGDSILLSSELPEDYSVTWSDGSDGTEAWFADPGTYFYQAEDLDGCIAERGPWEVLEDDFNLSSVLPDTSEVCSGNVLIPMAMDEAIIFTEWNGMTNASSLEVSESGEVSVEVINQSGCTVFDTTHVVILGDAPTVSAIYPESFCEGVPVTWEAEVTSSDGITSFAWSIDEVFIESDGPLISAGVEGWGEKMVMLTATTEVGCFGFFAGGFTVHPAPEVFYEEPVICKNTPLTIFSEVTYPDDQEGSVFWQSDVGSVAQENFIGSFGEAGFYSMDLHAISAEGCAASFSGVIEVLPSPELNFSVSWPRCVGEDLSYTSIASCPDCPNEDFAFNWNFGDGNFSGQTDAEHFYTAAGSYEVTLQSFTDQGCLSSYSNNVFVYDFPTVDFVGGPFCSGQPGTLVDFSSGTALWNYTWEIEGFETFPGSQAVEVTFPEAGEYEVYHEATAGGCLGTTTQTVEVFESPDPAFGLEQVGLPLDFQAFPADLDGADEWYLGADLISELDAPVISFDTTGTFSVMHRLTAANGCQDSLRLEIEVLDPYADIEVFGVSLTPVPEGYQVLARVVNHSTFMVRLLGMSIGIDGIGQTTEVWEGQIQPGEQGDFVFAQTIPHDSEGLVCVSAEWFGGFMPEADLVNNRKCEALQEETSFLLPYPNPTTQGWSLDVYLNRSDDDFAVRLYDAAGRIVRDLEAQLEEGFHRLQVDALGLRPGIYHMEISGRWIEPEVFQVMVSPLED